MRRVGSVVTLVALAVGAAGCAGASGGGSSSGKAANTDSAAAKAVRAAVSSTLATGSSHAKTTLTMAAPTSKVTLHGSGSFDFHDRKGRLTVNVPKSAAGQKAAVASWSGTLHEMLAPGSLYLKSNSDKKVPKGKWVKIPVSSLGDGNLVSGGATDPLTASAVLRGAQNVSVEGGHHTVDGVKVTRYRGTADLKRAAGAATSSEVKSALQAAAKSFRSDLVPFTADVDGKGRLRRIQEHFAFNEGSSDSADNAVRITSTTGMSDFGTPVHIAPPAKSAVYTGKMSPSPKKK